MLLSKSLIAIMAVSAAMGCGTPKSANEQVRLTDEPIKGVPFTSISICDGFWAPKIEINRTVSIPSALYQCEINGRFDNFAVAAGLVDKPHQGDFPFDDTDVYKVIEGASYSLAVQYDEALDHKLDSLISLIAQAQEDDGYLTTCVTNKCTRLSGWWGTHRWEKINSHELYNCGHLYEAAVAHYMATGKRSLLEVAIKNADLVCKVFGPAEGQKHVPSGHPIVEMALMRLYGVTGDSKYVDMARYFVEEAGRGTDGHRLNQYSQDHKPVLQQDEILGHAVRAGYFYSGVTDVTMFRHDTAYFAALCRIWNNLVSKKLYITGGVGALAQGEGFGPNYELPNQQAYCETCAAIANVFWNYRMFLATGDSRFVDVLERALYNGVISGVSLSGDRFFYDNPLESMGQHERQKWFGCACCPGNVTRFMASVPNYMYAVQGRSIFMNLFIQSNAEVNGKFGSVRLSQTTRYPWEGEVSLEVDPRGDTASFALKVRIPGWLDANPVSSDLYSFVSGTKGYEIKVNGRKVSEETSHGYVTISRVWKKGDVVKIEFPMDVRRIQANPEVEDDRGKVALERGPIVYCLEGADQPDSSVFDKYLPKDEKFKVRYDDKLLNGLVLVSCKQFTAIPYYAWNNRGAGQMEVWVPVSKDSTRVKPEPSIASEAQSYIDDDGHKDWAWGVNDQWEPRRSSDISKPYHYWWLKFGKPINIAYEFKNPCEVHKVEVYWLDYDFYDGDFRVPASWALYYKNGEDGEWKEVRTIDGQTYGVSKDRYNTVEFVPVTATDLKIEALLQDGKSGGVLEWKVF